MASRFSWPRTARHARSFQAAMTCSDEAHIGAARLGPPRSYLAMLSNAPLAAFAASRLAMPAGVTLGVTLRVIFRPAREEGAGHARSVVSGSAVMPIDHRAREPSAMRHTETLRPSTLSCLLRQVLGSLSTRFQRSGYEGNIRGKTLGGYQGKQRLLALPALLKWLRREMHRGVPLPLWAHEDEAQEPVNGVRDRCFFAAVQPLSTVVEGATMVAQP
jgi:hypothetical protein